MSQDEKIATCPVCRKWTSVVALGEGRVKCNTCGREWAIEKPQPDQFVLAVDPAQGFGVAVGSIERGYIASTAFGFQNWARKNSPGRVAKMVAQKLSEFVRMQAVVSSIDLLAYEMPTMHARNANPLPQWAMLVAAHLAADSCLCWKSRPYWPSTIKARGAEHGRAGKNDMMAAASKWVDAAITNDDEADAILLLKIALEDLREPAESQASMF